MLLSAKSQNDRRLTGIAFENIIYLVKATHYSIMSNDFNSDYFVTVTTITIIKINIIQKYNDVE